MFTVDSLLLRAVTDQDQKDQMTKCKVKYHVENVIEGGKLGNSYAAPYA